MIRVRVISLERAAARRRHVQREFAAAGVDYELFDAVDGRRGHQRCFDAYDPRAFVLNTGRLMTAGEIGCFGSHRALWQECAASGEPMLIMEDDFHLAPAFAGALATAARLAERCGFIRLQREQRARRTRIAARIADDSGFSLCYYRKPPRGMMCYLIAPRVANAFVRASAVMDAPVDVFVSRAWEHGQPLFGLQPYTVWENGIAARSTIGRRRKTAKDLRMRCARLAAKLAAAARRARFNHAALRTLHDDAQRRRRGEAAPEASGPRSAQITARDAPTSRGAGRFAG